jgi:hypothetical protein
MPLAMVRGSNWEILDPVQLVCSFRRDDIPDAVSIGLDFEPLSLR